MFLIRTTALAALLGCALAAPAFAIPDANGALVPPDAAAPQGEMAARLAYNLGFEAFEKTRAAEQALGADPKPAAKAKLLEEYRAERVQFEDAVKNDPNLKEAWNLVGYTSRRLGDYERSLAAYEKALALNPQYTEAIEYRAEAYLALDRLDDVRQAYLDLFGQSRAHAAVLMDAMQRYVAERRKSPGKLAAAQVEDFAKWVGERSALAQQTAALTSDSSTVRDWR